jgi:hypothetical protein
MRRLLPLCLFREIDPRGCASCPNIILMKCIRSHLCRKETRGNTFDFLSAMMFRVKFPRISDSLRLLNKYTKP